MQASSDGALVRALGVRSLTASIVNMTIGAGIFVLPAAGAAGLGPAAPIAYVVCAALMARVVSCFAAAGSRVSLTGGLYADVEVGFGPVVGFLPGVLYQVMGGCALWCGGTGVVLIFASLGVEVALVPSGEVRDPSRTVPRALFLALATTTTLYLLIQRVAQGLLGPAIGQFASAPLAEAASRVLGSGGRLLAVGGAIISMFGYVSGD